MLIPVRCVTCGKVLADMWRAYQRRLRELKDDGKDDNPEVGLMGPSAAKILDDMQITRMCCRRHMLTNIDAMHRI